MWGIFLFTRPGVKLWPLGVSELRPGYSRGGQCPRRAVEADGKVGEEVATEVGVGSILSLLGPGRGMRALGGWAPRNEV